MDVIPEEVVRASELELDTAADEAVDDSWEFDVDVTSDVAFVFNVEMVANVDVDMGCDVDEGEEIDVD